MEDNNGQNLNQDAAVQPQKNLAARTKAKSRRHKRKIGFYYSFLTIVLLFCLVQVGFGVILNISKIIAYKAKINTMEKVRDDAEIRNKELKSDIKQFSKTASLEEIARNNLKMAGEDEVLVIINNNQEPADKNKKHHNKKKHKK
ncbi:MAG: cell division protein FtsL [Brachyspira sp.]|nr:cell division protein FtsL [Brachyspira sp.]CCY23744.1 unknown [Brachyspira sp. CAG:484]